jgi:hypothetical protein
MMNLGNNFIRSKCRGWSKNSASFIQGHSTEASCRANEILGLQGSKNHIQFSFFVQRALTIMPCTHFDQILPVEIKTLANTRYMVFEEHFSLQIVKKSEFS